MKIPTKFNLYGQTIEVDTVVDLNDKEDSLGECRYRLNKILLQDIKVTPRPRTQQEEWFCHELVHYLLHHAGYYKLRSDEELVGRVGHLLHQALTTMEYAEE